MDDGEERNTLFSLSKCYHFYFLSESTKASQGCHLSKVTQRIIELGYIVYSGEDAMGLEPLWVSLPPEREPA